MARTCRQDTRRIHFKEDKTNRSWRKNKCGDLKRSELEEEMAKERKKWRLSLVLSMCAHLILLNF